MLCTPSCTPTTHMASPHCTHTAHTPPSLPPRTIVLLLFYSWLLSSYLLPLTPTPFFTPSPPSLCHLPTTPTPTEKKKKERREDFLVQETSKHDILPSHREEEGRKRGEGRKEGRGRGAETGFLDCLAICAIPVPYVQMEEWEGCWKPRCVAGLDRTCLPLPACLPFPLL